MAARDATASMTTLPLTEFPIPGGSERHIGRERWSAVATRNVYFAHQSVGSDIVGGLRALNDEFTLNLRIVRSWEHGTHALPAVVHFLVGQNGDFASKNAALLRFLEARRWTDRPIVVLKYCYTDVCPGTDIEGLFEEYRDTVVTIAAEYQDVTVVHATLPLTSTFERAVTARAKLFLGRETLRDAAIARHRYNSLLQAEFGGWQPIFDIARAEAERPDGSVAGFDQGGVHIQTLAPENTGDGCHLNRRGQRIVALAFLDVLAQVIEAKR